MDDGPRGALSERGLPSRELLTKLAWEPPQARERSFMRAERLMLGSVSSGGSMEASWASPGELTELRSEPPLPMAGGSVKLMTELRFEYSDLSVIGVRFGSRTARPEVLRWSDALAGPK